MPAATGRERGAGGRLDKQGHGAHVRRHDIAGHRCQHRPERNVKGADKPKGRGRWGPGRLLGREELRRQRHGGIVRDV